MTRKVKYYLSALVTLAILLLPVASNAQVDITLKNSFIEQYKDRATITATYTVDKAHKKPNPAAKDGDLHVAGRAPEIELATVAEIMNAASASQKAAVDLIHKVEGTGKSVKMTGAWRIWCEHGGHSDQVQGEKLEPFTTTNPEHVFEIHPITQINDKVILTSLIPIKGFDPKDAHEAFVKYESIPCKIIPGPDTTKIVTSMAGYNYVEFTMGIIDENQKEIEDGRLVFASVKDLDGELLIHKRRMVFVKDSPPEKAVRNLKKGDSLQVLGLPRVDLSMVSWRTAHSQEKPEVLTWNLPYEIIVVGVEKVIKNDQR